MGTQNLKGNLNVSDSIKINSHDVMSNFAPAYDNTATYAVGDLCTYQGKVYQCSTAIETAEDFDSTKWTGIDVSTLLSLAGGGTKLYRHDILYGSDYKMILISTSDTPLVVGKTNILGNIIKFGGNGVFIDNNMFIFVGIVRNLASLEPTSAEVGKSEFYDRFHSLFTDNTIDYWGTDYPSGHLTLIYKRISSGAISRIGIYSFTSDTVTEL